MKTEMYYFCPNCHKYTLIYIEANSESDYYANTSCEFCHKEIEDDALKYKIKSEIIDYFSSRGERKK